MTRDERYIAQRSDAVYVKIIDLENTEPDPGLTIMATYGTSLRKHFVHIEKKPLRKNWRDRAIAHFLSEKERA